MISVRRLPVGQLQTNCYLVIDEGKTLIIDPGDDADYIQRIITDEESAPTKIVATHGHYDHVLAVTELKLAYRIPFLMHKKDEFLLQDMKSSAIYYSGLSADPPPIVDKYLKNKDILTINHKQSLTQGEQPLTIIHTPGHTPGSISLYNKKAKIIIVGDLLFAEGGVGRTDFRYSNTSELKKSIAEVLKLPSDTIIYPGHGEETSVKKIKTLF